MDSLSSSDESWESDNCDASTSFEDSSTSYSGSSSNNSDDEDEDEDEDVEKTCPLSSTVANLELVDDCECLDSYSSCVREWTAKVPISMNLCPWAKLSHKKGRIRFVTCHDQTPHEASKVVWAEIDKLLETPLPAWSTTLVICPHVETWANDFAAFERFVKDFGKEEQPHTTAPLIGSIPSKDSSAITLVPFHPQFLRWRGLPETISTGSKIFCHRGLAGFSKSPGVCPATVIDLTPPGFGRRRIKVRFHEDPTTNQKRKTSCEQCIPLDWVQLLESQVNKRPILSDNAMHRAPYAVIHILRNEDLKSLTIQEISRLKRRNAKRMASETLV